MKKTINDFDLKYTLDTSIQSNEFIGEGEEGMLETYGKDMEKVLEINKTSPMRLWTMVDGEEGMILIQGLHYVNRIYYVVTEQEAESKNEEYLFEDYLDTESLLFGDDFTDDDDEGGFLH